MHAIKFLLQSEKTYRFLRQLVDLQLKELVLPANNLLCNLDGLEYYIENDDRTPIEQLQATLTDLVNRSKQAKYKTLFFALCHLDAFKYNVSVFNGNVFQIPQENILDNINSNRTARIKTEQCTQIWDPLSISFRQYSAGKTVHVWEAWQPTPRPEIVEKWLLKQIIKIA